MRYGVCGYLTGKNGDGTEFDLLKATQAAGFDYIELPLSTIAGLSEAEFAIVAQALESAGLPCEACNLFFPGNLRLTGAGVDQEKIEAYLRLALRRAGKLGAQVVVFGSGGARSAPAGFPREQAWVQLVTMLRMAGEIAAQNGLGIAIEPLNSAESNLINSGSEGYTLARLVDHANVGLLLDIYHMYKEGEDYGVAVTARDLLRHAHMAEPRGRVFPTVVDGEAQAFFGALKRAGYDGRVSVEARFEQFAVEAPCALEVMRTACC